MAREVTPEVAAGFSWEHGPTGRVLRADDLARVAPHLFTTRDRSFRGDTADADYRDLARAFDVPPGALVLVGQVHGRRVVTVRPGESFQTGTEADAIVSTDPSRVIAVRVADCVPILLAARRGPSAALARGLVAAIHAGWRGACAGVIGATVQAIAEEGAAPEELVAGIGPSIGPCHYQVDERVRHAFLAMTPDAVAWFAEDGPGHWRLDLWRAAVDQLRRAGVPADAIRVSRLCAAEHLSTCFSHRKEGPGTGRMVAAIGLAAPSPQV